MALYFIFFCVLEFGKELSIKGAQIESRCVSLITGICLYGRRLLIASSNDQNSCRGSCYWFIDQYFQKKEKSLPEIACSFEEGAPPEAIRLHQSGSMPAKLAERLIWEAETISNWPEMPELDEGIYTFLIGHSQDEKSPGKAHRIAFFKKKEKMHLFDPNTGLSVWDSQDWSPLLDQIGYAIKEGRAGFFTLRCYSHEATR